MIKIHFAMPLLAFPLLAVAGVAAAEESARRRMAPQAMLKTDVKIPAEILTTAAGPHWFPSWTTVAVDWNDQGADVVIPRAGDVLAISTAMSGPGTLRKHGSGLLRLTGANTYTGGTVVAEGTLRVGNGLHGSIVGDVVNNGLLEFDRDNDLSFNGVISGPGAVHHTGLGRLTLTADQGYDGLTAIVEGVLQLGDGGTAGALQGPIYTGVALVFDRRDALVVDSVIGGPGSVTQAGTGTTVLAGANAYHGVTEVRRGTLIVDGDQRNAKGPILVRSGAVLAGVGATGGSVVVENGGTLAAAQGGTPLAMKDLVMHPGATLRFTVGSESADADRPGQRRIDRTGRAGIAVQHDVTLDGTLDIAGGRDGMADRGLYRLIDYDGALTDRALEIRAVPQGSRPRSWRVLTSRPGRIDVVHDGGRPILYWRGSKAGSGNMETGGGAISGASTGIAGKAGAADDAYAHGGGSGTWRDGGLANWSSDMASAETAWTDEAMAVFDDRPGTIVVDDSAGPVRFSGAQFMVDGYTVTGPGTLTTDTPDTVLRVGDGRGAGTGAGAAGPAGAAGVAEVASAAAPAGAAEPASGAGPAAAASAGGAGGRSAAGQAGSTPGGMRTVLQANIIGSGGIVKTDAGTLVLDGANLYTGGTTIRAGTLEIRDDRNLGAPHARLVFDGGALRTNANIASGRPVDIGPNGGTADTAGHTLRWAGPLGGSGMLTKTGRGTLELAGANTAEGGLSIAAGTVRAGAANALGAAMRYTVADGTTLDAAGGPQTIAGLVNAGTVTLDSPLPGNTLTVRGDYIGQDGALRLATTLGGSDSPTDRLIIDGGRASGRTKVAIINVGGLGAATDGDGIEVIRAVNGATTTAQTTRDAFVLLDGHVDAGAYEYRLYPADARGAGESWFLRSALPTSGDGLAPGTGTDGGGGTGGGTGDGKDMGTGTGTGTANDNGAGTGTAPRAGRVTYRPEVALYAALPAALAQTDLAMLGNLHRREGDGAVATPMDADATRRRVWGRLIDQNTRVRQQGSVAPRGQGWTSGGQLGIDLLASGRHRAGLYGGTLGWRSKVHGDASGIPDRAVGHLRGRADYAGAYWTYTGDTGGYGDVVLQHGRQRGNASAITGSDGDIRARSTLASLETGVPLPVGRQWQAEPQAQILFAHRHIDDLSIAAATVRQHPGNATVARLGVRLKGDYTGAQGTALPYIRFNLWHGLSGTDTQSIAGPGGKARIDTRRGYTSGEIAAGGTWMVNRRIALYGEIGSLFPLGGEQRVSTRRAISAGMRIAW